MGADYHLPRSLEDSRRTEALLVLHIEPSVHAGGPAETSDRLPCSPYSGGRGGFTGAHGATPLTFTGRRNSLPPSAA